MRKIRVLDNVYDLITINMEDRFKDNVAFRFYDTANDAVTTILYKDYVQDIRKAVNYFQSTIPEIKGKKICLLTKNSYEYAVNTFGVVVYCDEDKQQQVRDFITEANRTLPLYKRMSAVEFSAQPLPRNAMGKLLR